MQEKKMKEMQPLVDEANWIADELLRKIKFNIKL